MDTAIAMEPIVILMVEDNPADARLAEEALKESKIINRLYHAWDGEKAMDFLHRRDEFTTAPRPDIVFLDLNLPRKDGREVLAEMKQHPDLKRIPVVVLTTSDAEQDILKSYDLHANCYLTKPVDLDKFTHLVHVIEDFWLSIVKLPKA